MAVRGVDPNEEKKSYGTVFFVGSILLVVVSLWAVFDDNITRRVWKKHQAEFNRSDYERAEAALAKEQKRLNADPKFRELVKKRDAELESLEAGDKHARLADTLMPIKRSSSSRASRRKPGTSTTTRFSRAGTQAATRSTLRNWKHANIPWSLH